LSKFAEISNNLAYQQRLNINIDPCRAVFATTGSAQRVQELSLRQSLLTAPVTATIAATAFAPVEPMPFFLKLSDTSFVSLLLWMALQTALTPSSLRLFEDKSRAVSPRLQGHPE
jgi:hypothetical protein